MCHLLLDGERELESHPGKGDGVKYRCGVKQTLKMISMAETGERKFVCKVCKKGFKQKRQLTDQSTVHTKLKAYKCDKCDLSYTLRQTLNKHKKVKHEGVECVECGKGFGQKENRTSHFKQLQEVFQQVQEEGGGGEA